MLFAEQPQHWDGWTIEILGTDVSHRAIAAARAGRYSQFEVQRGLSVGQMLTHFDEDGGAWQIREPARALTQFQQHNILDHAPGRKIFDLILCRNVLLYFNQQTRAHTFMRLSEALASDGYLMLGAGETVSGQTDLFAPAIQRIGLFQPRTRHDAMRLAIQG
jgi:chemotaxis protein methyltransferase CheR